MEINLCETRIEPKEGTVTHTVLPDEEVSITEWMKMFNVGIMVKPKPNTENHVFNMNVFKRRVKRIWNN